MDETEITNSEYRSFVHWVRDSIIRRNLAIMVDVGKTSADGGIGDYAFRDAEEDDLSVYEKYMKDNYSGMGEILMKVVLSTVTLILFMIRRLSR